MNAPNAMDLQHNKEMGIFIKVELELVLASDIWEWQRNFAESFPKAMFSMLKVT